MVSYGRFAGQQALGAGIRGGAQYLGFRARQRYMSKNRRRPSSQKFRRGLDRRNVGNYKFKALQEKKFFETSLTAVAAQAGTIIDSINHVAQGTAENERIGRKITITNINIRGKFFTPAGGVNSTQASHEVRYILYLDKQCNGATATATTILETAATKSFLNLANSSRFVILQDLFFHINLQTQHTDATHFAQAQKTHKYNKRCNIPIEFNDVAGVIAEIRSNNIGLIVLASENDPNGTAYSGTCRIRFTDS